MNCFGYLYNILLNRRISHDKVSHFFRNKSKTISSYFCRKKLVESHNEQIF